MATKRKRKSGYWTDILYLHSGATPESIKRRLDELTVVLAAMKKIRKVVRVIPDKWNSNGFHFQAFRK
jgi:hypothetical protein